ncbi:GEM-like protein 5 [Silene latifolia]|uniref:GEM-like protein 5 n=1 Tax=Silene latifolia TaxID=37657 RepID=UPI003D77AC54
MNDHSTSIPIQIKNHDNPYIKNTPVSAPDTLYAIGKSLDRAVKSAGNMFTQFNPIARHIRDFGLEQCFRRDFGVIPGEKLMKGHPCCLSSTGGPIQGTLYVSNKRVGFISEDPMLASLGCGPVQWVYYKVVIRVDCIQTVKSMDNRQGRGMDEKYIEIITRDGYEFWFMGFKDSYDLAFENLFNAIRLCNN